MPLQVLCLRLPRLPGKIPRFDTSDRPLTPGNRKPSVSVVPDRRRVDRLLLIRLVLDLCRQSDRRATIKLILLLLIPMVLCWRHYRRPVLPPDVELHRLPRNHRLLRIVQRSALIPPVRNTNLTVVPRECPWWIFLESLQATLNVTSASRVIFRHFLTPTYPAIVGFRGTAIGSKCVPLIHPKSEPDQRIGAGPRLVL